MLRRVLVLTGPVHSGKTTFLKGAAVFWDLAGFSIGGFLNETRFAGGMALERLIRKVRGRAGSKPGPKWRRKIS